MTLSNRGRRPMYVRSDLPFICDSVFRNFCCFLFGSEGEAWATLRSALSKGILKPTALAPHVDSMHEVALDFVAKLKSIRRPDGVIPDIETELYKWSMECKCLLTANPDSLLTITLDQSFST